MNNMPKLKELLESESFRTKTSMYIGEKRLSTLKAFFDGIFYSINVYNVREENIFAGFNEWTEKYYGWKDTTAGWKEIILTECKNDENKAVDEFFKIYDRFKLR